MIPDPTTLDRLCRSDTQSYIRSHTHDDPASVALRCAGINGIPPSVLATQIACRAKALRKLPSLSALPLLYDALSLEQCSSEACAGYKSTLIEGNVCIDLTGGMGIDTLFFARHFNRVHYCERDGGRVALFERNARCAGLSSIRIHQGDSMALLAAINEPVIDLLYADPSRRSARGGRIHSLAGSVPDIVSRWGSLLERTRHLMVKCSPLWDADEAARTLPALARCIYVSCAGECRELLLLATCTATHPTRICAAVATAQGGWVELEREAGSVPPAERDIAPVTPGWYLFDPDPALRAGRLEAAAAQHWNLSPVNRYYHYLTAPAPISSFAGRVLRIIDSAPFHRRKTGVWLKGHGVSGATICARGGAGSSEHYRSLLGIGESARVYLVLVRTTSRTPLCALCVRE